MQNSIVAPVKVLRIRLLLKGGSYRTHLEVLQKTMCRYWVISINDTNCNAQKGSVTIYVFEKVHTETLS